MGVEASADSAPFCPCLSCLFQRPISWDQTPPCSGMFRRVNWGQGCQNDAVRMYRKKRSYNIIEFPWLMANAYIYYVFFCFLLFDRSFSFHWDLGGCILMKRGPVEGNSVKLCVFSLTIVVIIFIILLLLLLLLIIIIIIIIVVIIVVIIIIIIIIIRPFLSIQLKGHPNQQKNPQFLRWKSTTQGARDLRNCSSMEFFLKDLDPFWTPFCGGSLVSW